MEGEERFDVSLTTKKRMADKHIYEDLMREGRNICKCLIKVCPELTRHTLENVKAKVPTMKAFVMEILLEANEC
jgi:hypothetical protein